MPAEYENPFRPAYEFKSAALCAGSALASIPILANGPLPIEIRVGVAAALGMWAFVRGKKAISVRKRTRRLTSGRRFLRKESEIGLEELRAIARKNEGRLWLGKGFDWSNVHRQRMKEVLDGMDRTKLKGPAKSTRYKETMGAVWVHGLEAEETEDDLFINLNDLYGHLLIIGTTRAGKTVLLSHAIAQAIERGECVICIDPKGDSTLKKTMELACKMAGRQDKFLWFHPAFPETSARLDPLCSYNRVTELASRIASLIPSSRTGGDSFVAFSQRAVNAVVNGLLLVERKPSLVEIRRVLESEGRLKELTWQALDAYCKQVMPNWEAVRERVMSDTGDVKASKIIDLYRKHVQEKRPNTDLEGLISQFEHPHEHFGKMIAVLLPILDMLTSGPLAALLSPEYWSSDSRGEINLGEVMEQRRVLYVGLDCLSDAMVGSAIGAMFLSDLASESGRRYNYNNIDQPINVFIDEGAEVGKHIPFIQLLNKSGGAKFRIAVAVQTIADFAAALGSKDMATQVLGNENSWIALRLRDGETQKYLADNLPKTTVKYVMATQGTSIAAGTTQFDGNVGERLMEEEAELYPPAMLGEMPTCEFIGNICGRIVKGRMPFIRFSE